METILSTLAKRSIDHRSGDSQGRLTHKFLPVEPEEARRGEKVERGGATHRPVRFVPPRPNRYRETSDRNRYAHSGVVMCLCHVRYDTEQHEYKGHDEQRFVVLQEIQVSPP